MTPPSIEVIREALAVLKARAESAHGRADPESLVTEAIDELATLRQRVAELERDLDRERNAHAGTAGSHARLRADVEQAERERDEARATLAKFAQHEWVRTDWLGLCSFRYALRCPGSDGVNSGFGTPKPKPHSEHCPFSALAAAKGGKVGA